MEDTVNAEAVALLEVASIDPVIANEIVDCVLDGYEEEAIEKLLDEMDIDEDQAQVIYDHLRGVLPGENLDIEEITSDLVTFVAVSEMPRSGNPFVRRTAYFARRGMRVFSAFPVRGHDGIDGFHMSGSFYPANQVSQIWRTVPSARSK